ncbi:MAG: PKD domain-containing protein [Clostridiales bacterium]|nr:PKD domain-containing protein [Clostridiales bacterium]
MRNKKIIVFLLCVMVLTILSSYAETKKLKRIGQYTFARVKGRIPTAEVMKMLVDRYAGDIKYGFDLAGYGDLYLPFLDQLKAASFEEKALPVGDKLMWMLFRSQNRVKVVKDIEWAGKAPLEVFVFNVTKDYKKYEFVMPRPCGNIALRSITDMELPPAVCALSVTPAKINLKDPITIDMSGTQMAASMEVDVIGPDGQKIVTHSFKPGDAAKRMSFDKPGVYAFKGRAVNPQGKASTNPCEAKVVVNAPPTCSLTTSCLPCKDYVGRPVTIDASASSDPDGNIAKADFEITDESGNVVDKFMDNQAPFVWDKIFDKPGIYTISLVVTDDFGAVSEPCRLSLEVTQKRNFISVEGGPFFARGSHGPYLYAMLDWLYWITPYKVDFTLAGGGALALKSDPWKSIFLADATLNYHAGPVYFGGGLGLTTEVKEGRDADFELVGKLGYDVFKTWSNTGSLVFTVRWPLGSERSFSKNHKFALGFRVLF